MKKYVVVICICAFIFCCKRNYNTAIHTYEFVPESSTTVIKVNEITDFKSALQNNEVLNALRTAQLKNTSTFLDHINVDKELLIAFDDRKDTSGFLLISKVNSTIFSTDSTEIISENLKAFAIEKTTINDHVIYHTVIDSIFLGSNDLEVVKNVSKNRNNRFKRLLTTTDEEKTASIIFNDASRMTSKLYLNVLNDSVKLTDYSVLDFEFDNDDLKYNGITKALDSTYSLINSFKKTNPQESKVIELSPSDVTSLTSISFNEHTVFNSNLSAFNHKAEDSISNFLNYANEIGLISKANNNAIILHSLNPEIILESIVDFPSVETFRDVNIFEFDQPEFFKLQLSPFMQMEKANYFFIYEEFIAFSESIGFLKSIIVDKLNDNTLHNSEAFKAIAKNLSDASSLFVYKNSEALSDVLGKPMNGYNANAVQFVYDNNFAHVNGIVKKFKKRSASQSVTEAFSVALDADLVSGPQAVKNHVTKAHDIVAQDINNDLYLISSGGNVLWKKTLDGKILGRIEQMDIYKNGRLQLVFATPNRVYVIDRNGKDVTGFPLKFNDKITQPLSLFDYDSNKNYRLLVTQGRHLLMYNRYGKPVPGFNYSKSQKPVSSQPKHFRVAKKDYIVFSAGNKLNILNRQGKTRIDVKDNIRFSGNSIYLYKNKFTTTNTLGQLVQVDTKGNLSTKNLILPENHLIDATSKTMVSLTDGKLNIKSRTVDLDYGDYTRPRIFYINDKIYVTTTDRQSKKIYLYDSQAKPIPNFPVFGTSSVELQELDKESGLELITQSDAKTITVYKLN